MCSIDTKIIIASILLVAICEFVVVSSTGDIRRQQALIEVNDLVTGFNALIARFQTGEDLQNLIVPTQNLHNQYLRVSRAVSNVQSLRNNNAVRTQLNGIGNSIETTLAILNQVKQVTIICQNVSARLDN
uniref:Uncharacterized protein n=1 Tax=Meloidogyne enterolobii TaxID=390850 RepID=A0A6V7TRK3_MELEN|nr:unnamed protein product [Meloidogyne enterolobii]